MAAQLEDCRRVLRDVRRELFHKPNVVAVGVGYKTVAGKRTEQLSLICSVEVKKSKGSLSPAEIIPESIQGIPTDVYASGILYAQQSPTGRHRPAPGGVSIGHYLITAGTLGCLVRKNNTTYILSNNHVLANSNDASSGDAILQPGPYDGGQQASDTIATLTEFIPIQFTTTTIPCPIGNAVASTLNGVAAAIGSKTRLQAAAPTAAAADNLVDCAIAQPINPNDVVNNILGIGQITGVAEGTLGMALKKSGRTTGLTTGTITQIDVTANVSYGSNKVGTFVDQLMAGAMSQGGDSGSAVLNNQNQIVGLLFAGSNTSTIINRIQNVFQLLQVTLP
ncbi:hypothetical protein FBQ87_16120 [Sphingobacteriales bacterium CHB3]|nr:hypothetical protein [Sphingobacteriales bacterium CHB3]